MSDTVPSLHWQCLRYTELARDDLFDLLKLRCEVFIVEQRCPYPDPDEKDRGKDTRHLLARAPDGSLAAYARLIPPGMSFTEASFGRVITSPGWRGRGLGHGLAREILTRMESLWPAQPIRIGAQAHLVNYYRQHGFEPVGEAFDEDGIPHRHMLRPGGTST